VRPLGPIKGPVKQLPHSLHWFRNDLRLDDNRALAAALTGADRTTCLFVVDPGLLTPNAASKRRAFLAACLKDLDAQLSKRQIKLLFVAGAPEQVVPAVAQQLGVSRVTFGRDYSPRAKRRDAAVAKSLKELSIETVTTKDRVILEAAEVRTRAGTPYRVYTPYRRAWLERFDESEVEPCALPPKRRRVGAPPVATVVGRNADDLSLSLESALQLVNPTAAKSLLGGGERTARRTLKRFIETHIDQYDERRNLTAEDGTSRLSPYLRFGVLSPRRCVAEARNALADQGDAGTSTWLDQIVWREFYIAVLDSFPDVLNASFRAETASIEWADDEDRFRAWCDGKTGYPMVDAGMRQLVAEGWMHNRARMVTASFLVKDLLIDWRRGQRFFAEHLLDADPAANNGGWQWCASTGTDAQPYFRIFNPVRQGQRFDPHGVYVRRWVPELDSVPSKWIHEPWKAPTTTTDYPMPIVDHQEQRPVTIARFQAARERSLTDNARGGS
jgi:deoxyribodipyrimidine photo-lyase